MVLTTNVNSNGILNQLSTLEAAPVSTYPWTVSMTSYFKGTAKATLLCIRLSTSPSFALQKQIENGLLESI